MTALDLLSEITRNSVSSDGSVMLAHLDGWDSLKGVRLVLRIEEIVDRQLSEADIEALRTVGDVDRLLKAA